MAREYIGPLLSGIGHTGTPSTRSVRIRPVRWKCNHL